MKSLNPPLRGEVERIARRRGGSLSGGADTPPPHFVPRLLRSRCAVGMFPPSPCGGGS